VKTTENGLKMALIDLYDKDKQDTWKLAGHTIGLMHPNNGLMKRCKM
jgi:hypothetical protein